MAWTFDGATQYGLVNSIDFSSDSAALVSIWVKLNAPVAGRMVLFEYANVVGGSGGIGFDFVFGNPDNAHGLVQMYNGVNNNIAVFKLSDLFFTRPIVGTWVGITAGYLPTGSIGLSSNLAGPVPLVPSGVPIPAVNWSANAQFSIGARVPTPASLFLNGSVAEPAVWISRSMVTALTPVGYTGATLGAPWRNWLEPQGSFYAPMYGDPSPEPDLSPSHKPITLVGGPTVASHPGGAPYQMLPGFGIASR